MNPDEKFYLKARQEVESLTYSEALWTKSLALSAGDELRAKWLYVAERAQQLSDIEEGERLILSNNSPGTSATVPELPSDPTQQFLTNSRSALAEPVAVGNYVRAADVAEVSGVPLSTLQKACANLRIDGSYRDGEWWIHSKSVAKLKNAGLSFLESPAPSFLLYWVAWILWGIFSTLGAFFFVELLVPVKAGLSLVIAISSLTSITAFWLIYTKLFDRLRLGAVMPYVYFGCILGFFSNYGEFTFGPGSSITDDVFLFMFQALFVAIAIRYIAVRSPNF